MTIEENCISMTDSNLYVFLEYLSACEMTVCRTASCSERKVRFLKKLFWEFQILDPPSILRLLRPNAVSNHSRILQNREEWFSWSSHSQNDRKTECLIYVEVLERIITETGWFSGRSACDSELDRLWFYYDHHILTDWKTPLATVKW